MVTESQGVALELVLGKQDEAEDHTMQDLESGYLQEAVKLEKKLMDAGATRPIATGSDHLHHNAWQGPAR